MKINPSDFFLNPDNIAHKQYEALRMFYLDKVPAKDVAVKFGYTYRGFTTLCTQFRDQLKMGHGSEIFFAERKKGRKVSEKVDDLRAAIIAMRKNFYSVQDIKIALDSSADQQVSESTIYKVLRSEGFGRLPRRMTSIRQNLENPKLKAPKAEAIDFHLPHNFKSASAGILCLLPIIEQFGIRRIIQQSSYPQTSVIDKLKSILCFVALKSSNIRRYSADDIWCTDRGLGLFAGLNVLPKASWFTSYSHRVTTTMNREFLQALHKVWLDMGLLSDTSNLDFTSIPYWGEGDHLENNWSGKRGKALSSMLAVLAQDPQSGIIDYGDVNVRHDNQSAVVLEYLDFYKKNAHGHRQELQYLVFDSKFTNYQNLDKLNKNQITFLTIRRRGKNMVDRLNLLPKSQWKRIRVPMAGNKKRTIKVFDQMTTLRGYEGEIRQIAITGHGKVKPAIIITNEQDVKVETLVRKYARRWLVEKGISEQIEFFHLNKVSSSMVIKVDFDLTMTILTHNLFRLFADHLVGYQHQSDQTIYEKFLLNMGDIQIEGNQINIHLKKKRNLPAILEMTQQYDQVSFPWLNFYNLNFVGATYS